MNSPQAMVLAVTAKTFSQRPSSLLGLTGPRVALDLDQTLAVRLKVAENRDQRAHSNTPFGRLDAVLAGQGPQISPDGLRYQSAQAVYDAEMEARRREGLVH